MEIFIKRLTGLLFSSRLMVILILLFAISIATATFIENDFGSATARAVVYNAWWFNTLLFLGIINLAGTILVSKLYRKEKLSIFLFHFAFLLILAGAAITRFIGFEGMMHIRSGEQSSTIVSSNNYLILKADSKGNSATAEKQVHFSKLTGNKYKVDVRLNNQKISAKILKVIPNAIENMVYDPAGKPMIQLVFSGMQGRQTVVIAENQPKQIGEFLFTMNDSSNLKGVDIRSDSSGLFIRTSVSGMVMNMRSQQSDSVVAGKYYPLQLKSLYNLSGLMLVPDNFISSAAVSLSSGTGNQSKSLPDAVFLQLTSGSSTKEFRYFSVRDAVNKPAEIAMNDVIVSVSVGAREVQIPFALRLNQFIIERYPGSESPSWFESRITLTDAGKGIQRPERVYMNNILKYGGYRFYQSSYDTDEKGTIFSVNHDLAGTIVTYVGYLLLAIGILFSLFNKRSRFQKLSVQLESMRGKIPLILVLFLFISGISAIAGDNIPDSVRIDAGDAAKFGKLLIQDPAGRIKPVNTMSSELLRKVSRTTEFMGQTPDQVLLGMLVYPSYWQEVPMIRVSHPEIKKILNVSGNLVSFTDFFDLKLENVPYKLSRYVNASFQKKPASRSTFDTEIIRLDERVNLCYQLYSGSFLRLFPKPGDPGSAWYSPATVSGHFNGNDSVFVSSIVPLYLQSLSESTAAANKIRPDEALSAIHNFQVQYGSQIMPSSFRIQLEVLYNRLNIFDKLSNAYGLIGFLLLVVHFILIFRPTIKLRPLVKVFTWILLFLFLMHFTGLISRWVISGHAPWSNGYESLIYIAFATVVAGLIFSGKSSITLAITSLLAWLILFVAHLNWMDPQITNLVPVLKSYWLLIHVAVITASYGFLAMGALLAFLNLVLMISQTPGNYGNTSRMISEFSIVIEMTLIIGLYLLTIGTFLGGVWANESWGRYWGWDPKETWALVSVLIYAFVAHMRLVPGLKGNYLFNLFSVLAFSSIIMTYFGVNYYLSGMHSYAKGDPLPVPSFVYYTLAIVGLVALLAWENQRRMTHNNWNK
jgi:cytochrome c-type biogenesis protein CcsB